MKVRENVKVTVDQSYQDVPWERYDWAGELTTVDGCDTTDFTRDDVEELVREVKTDGDWSGESCGLAKLKDGRFIAWESDWDATGSGFCCDAYGGTAGIVFGKTAEGALAGLTEKAREMYNWTPYEAE